MRNLPRWLVVTALLAACDQSASPVDPATVGPNLSSTAEHLTSIDPFGVDIFTNPCTGEQIAVSGEIHHTLNIVTDADGFEAHVSDLAVLLGKATGLTTGTTYLIKEPFQVKFNTPSLTAPPGTFTVVDMLTLVSQGSADNLVVQGVFHLTFTGLGEVKTTVDLFNAKCVG
jgi:hypothetical protein